ncbi:glycosyltransferase family protein [Aquiflexum gelatinilyticum]|uniref:glycosyltransferase family protein n=1 Tax=Aquiflexum gelatinilyticum TaxID=2961943 RepID=UPI002169805C|nr:glycosyltransferase [Aquiflexum gelatinilyticum]MCS4432857.1 hypothetical protein [Aquiflexum gelatinilyticum]
MNQKILLHCQYVYGIGHLVRAVELARGLSNHFQIFILNGGEAVPNFDIPENLKIIQMPAIYKEENSDSLLSVDPSINIEQCFKSRKKIITQSVEEIKPDILITEHFPFGLLFENEVLELIDKVKIENPKAKIVSSVRDIIESKGGGKRDDYVCELINKWYDLVLVHGDGNFAGLSKSFSKTEMIKIPVIQTGYITREIPKVKNVKKPPLILASVAAGRMGNELLDSLIDSHLRIKEKKRHNLVLFSGAFQKDFKKQQEKVISLKSKGIEIHLFDSRKYLKYLSNASLVISLGGYNSIIESVSAKKPMLIYQRGFSGGNEEQNMRIQLFQKNGNLDILKSDDLNSETLSLRILNAINNPKAPDCELNLNGVYNSSQALTSLMNS